MQVSKDTKWLQWVTQQFENIAREDWEINLKEFKRALNVKESFFAERAAGGARPLTRGNPMDKLKFLFQVYDVDGEGSSRAGTLHSLGPHPTGSDSVDVDELRLVLQSCLRASAISLPEEKLYQLTLALFQAADSSPSLPPLHLSEQSPLSCSAACWLTPPANRPHPHRPRPLTSAYWHNHCNQLLCLATYSGLQVLLFALAASAHQPLGTSIMVAKGCGQCLNFNCSFIAVLMLRRCLTWLRATWLAQVLPLDYAVQFHQLMGYTVVGLSLVHTVAHVVNFALLAQSGASPFQFWELLLTTRPGIAWVYGLASPTGVVLLLLLLLMVVCSSPCVRKSGHFQVFYWTHLSYLPLCLLLMMHGPNFWKWLLVPGILFFLEKAVGLAWSRMAPLHVVEVNLLPSKVTHLLIKRPPLFHYKAGDYLYLNIPSMARSEWHPFTISSASQTQWLHIRSQGQWTNGLYESFKVSDPVGCDSKKLSRSLRMRRSQRRGQWGCCSPLSPLSSCSPVQCYIDGPCKHAVLIGAGIGITPFASILQSITHRHQRRKHVCPSCQHSWMDGGHPPLNQNPSLSVDLIWINRDQRSFEWFVSLLTKLEMDQAQEAQDNRFLELHMYMTSVLGKNDMKAIGLQMALDLLAKKENKDSIMGLQTRTQPGRPDWSQVFQKVAAAKKGKVQVFFCGSPALAKVLKCHCEQFGFRFFQENF
uniref:NADPH oxidase 5 n=1 Tax=Sciurus vulgaris TaxID=55149 RepID=A0A8D2BAI1_SCIVU